jgi:osmoprotectant transport system permease protein
MIDTILEVWKTQDLSLKTVEHLSMFGWALGSSIIIGITIGVFFYKRSKLANISFNILNTIELIPTLALLILFLPFLGLGAAPTIAACVLYSILPIARNTYTGLTSINKEYIEIAKGLGLSSREILLKVRVPYSLPLIMSGIRIAIVFTMGVITLGGLIAAGGLGEAIQTGLQFINMDIIIVSSIWVGILAILFDGIAGFLEKTVKRRYEIARTT